MVRWSLIKLQARVRNPVGRKNFLIYFPQAAAAIWVTAAAGSAGGGYRDLPAGCSGICRAAAAAIGLLRVAAVCQGCSREHRETPAGC